MNALVPIALFGWIPVVIFLFAFFKPRRAVIAAFLLSWLFLPMAGYDIQGWPDYTKVSAACMGVLLGAAIFDFDRLMTFRPRWFDLPMAVLCVSPFFTSLTNDLGAYDGVSAVIGQMFIWGLPYFIGRVYFNDLAGLRELAIGIVVGGMIYVPLCLWEIRMSPQLHKVLYGYHQHSFLQHVRMGGYRPMVFMQHGLMVAFWMMSATLIGGWLWLTGSVKRLAGVSMGWIVGTLLVTTILCKSLGAAALLALGAAIFYATKKTRSAIPVICLVAMPLVYMGVRQTQLIDRRTIYSAVPSAVGERATASLYARLVQEDVMSEHAWKRPVLGWGRWDRSRPPKSELEGKVRGVDSMWIQMLGMSGIVGLLAATAAILLPLVYLLRKVRPAFWTHPKFAPPAALSVMLGLYMCDNMMNSMENPIFILVLGGLTGWIAAQRERASAPARSLRTEARAYAVATERIRQGTPV